MTSDDDADHVIVKTLDSVVNMTGRKIAMLEISLNAQEFYKVAMMYSQRYSRFLKC
jgi:uncharacterized protein (UPF0261 family)